MARGNDSSKPLADDVRFWVTDPVSRREIRQITSHSESEEGGMTVVTTPSGVAGQYQSAGGYGISLTVRHARSVRDDVAWHVLRDANQRFTFEVHYVGGQVIIYRDVAVSTIGRSAGDDGNVEFSVELMATRREVLETAGA